jgi:hypothetical protein
MREPNKCEQMQVARDKRHPSRFFSLNATVTAWLAAAQTIVKSRRCWNAQFTRMFGREVK